MRRRREDLDELTLEPNPEDKYGGSYIFRTIRPSRLKRAWAYLFKRRLAVKPSNAEQPWPNQMRYEWQRMPEGWRWF